MNIFQRILSLLSVFALVAICNAGDPSAFSIFMGELITIDPEVTDEAQETKTAQSLEPVDLSNATLTISYETTNAEGEVETETLYEGSYDGEFRHTLQKGQTIFPFTEPTEVKISLQVTPESDPMTINTVMNNGSDVEFAYVDHPGPRDEFLLVGSSNQVLNPEKQFSIKGDLNFLDLDALHTTSVFAWAVFTNDEGVRQSKQWGPVLVKDGTFHIEGDIERTLGATLYVTNRNQHSFYNTTTRIILEPNSTLVVAKLGNQTQEISTVSGSGYHAKLVESWQQSHEYVALVEAWTTEQERFNNPSADTVQEASQSTDDADDEANTESDEDGDSDSDEIVEVVDAVYPPPAEGCEDAVAQQEEPESTEPTTTYERPLWVTLRTEASNFQTEALQDIALNNKDPIAQLLAMQWNVFSPYENADKALAVWKALSEKFSSDYVATHIQPAMDRVELVKARMDNDAALIPGQKVPAFTLASLEGEDVSIYDLMGEKDLVLIDFWASWCGPCIATFPDLKKLHAAYTDENFEIVGVSVDDNLEDWSGGVEDHSLPWIQLGELKDADNGSPVSKSYGVNFIPKTFLVDSQGCIYRKNIHPSELKTFLVDRYGMDESLVEPEEEPEDTPEISS